MLQSNRNLNFPHLLNARDLGGCARRNGAQTRWQSLLRADELSRLSPEGVNRLLDYGVRTVIDLRWPSEVKARPIIFQLDSSRVHYIHISLLGLQEATWGLQRAQVTKELWNCVVLDAAKEQICDVMQAIAGAPEGGVLFHCESGKDRTGLIAALLLALADVEPTVIAHDYAMTTNNLRAAYLAANPEAQAVTLERVRCPPERVHNMLAHLVNCYGDVTKYLQHIGLNNHELLQISRRLCPDPSYI